MTRARTTAPAAAVVPQRQDPKAAYDNIIAAIERDRDKLVRSLAAVHIAPERFLSVVDQALRRSPGLLECTPSSILKSLLDAAELGLVPSGLIGQAYLVPYRNKNTGRKEAQLIPGYRGLIDLVRRSGELRSIEARVVRANDEFDIEFGTEGYVRHKPYINRSNEMVEVEDRPGTFVTKDGGPYIGVYLIAELAFGRHVEWMSYAEVEAIRRRSKAAADGPWVTDWAEMGKKTVARRGIKYLPLAIDSPVNRALALEDEAESGAMPVTARRAVAREALQSVLLDGATVEDEAEAQVESETERETCAAEREGEFCWLAPGHEGPHQTADAVWPVEDAALPAEDPS